MSQSSSTTLLLMDFHAAVVQWHGAAGSSAVDRAAAALAVARKQGMPIFHVLPHYRSGYPELRQGQPFDDVINAGLFREATLGGGIDARLVAGDGEAVVAKCRYSPFFANDLLHLLRMRNVTSLVLAGIATSGVVLSGVRDAWDLDYRITVLEDACADPDEEVHRVLTKKILPSQARVLTVQDWVAAM